MKKIIIIALIAIIGVIAFFFLTSGPDEATMKKNENVVRQYLAENEKVSNSDISRLEATYNSRESNEKFRYMVEVELKSEPDVIRMFTVDKGIVLPFGKVQK
ncbi:MAG: hypothetical protein K0R71_346 [Bacillales bacterium]|jgi:uncharacterized protein YxeA|nr:hypothetical protein [Bacillales bacterium]